MDDEDCNIRVICRFRPVNQRERDEGADVMANQIKFQDDAVIEVAEFNGRPAQTFFLDKVFHDPKTTQQDIYNLAARKSIDDVIKGYNATIFAYGQTGAGKSFTMFGPDIVVADLKGIIPRACMHIFEHIAADKEGTEYTIKCSFLEIYKEVVRDLLNPATHGNKQGLKVREAPSRGVWVEGLREEYVSCEQDVINLIQLGEKYRAVSATKMNAVSSRSHSLFILSLHQKSKDGSTKEGRLNLADLAGCEKVAKTGASGETLEEAKKINQSLSALGNCINALTKSKKSHIPYRDSKLTFILRESLGGNCKTTLLVACSPHIFNLEETIGTLQFAKRAKSIKNSVKVNKQRSVAELIAIIEKMKKELLYMRKYSLVLEQVLEGEKGSTWKDLLPSFADHIDSSSSSSDRPPSKPKANHNNNPSSSSSSPSSDHIANGDHENGNNENIEGDTEEPNDEDDDEKENGGENGELYLPGTDSHERLSQLRSHIKTIQEETSSKVQSLKDEIEILKKENSPLMESINIKKRIIKELDDSFKSLTTDLENAKQQKEKLESRLQFQFTQSQIKKEEQERHITSLTDHNSDLKLQVEKLIADIDLMGKEIEQCEEQKISLSLDITLSSDKIKENEEKIKRAEEEVVEVKAAHKLLKNRHFELTHSIKSVDQKISSHESQISLQQQISSELSTKLAFETEEKEKLEKELVEIEERINDYEDILSKAQSELSTAQRVEEEMKKGMLAASRGEEGGGDADLDADLSSSSSSLHPAIISHKQLDQIRKEKEKLKGTSEHLESQLNQEKITISEVNDQIAELIDSQKLEIENTDRLFELQLDNLKMRVELLESQLHDEEEENSLKIKSIEKKIENAETKYNNEKSSRLSLEESLHRKSEMIAEKDKLIRHSTGLQSDLDRAITVQLSSNEGQERSLQTLCDRLRALENELKLQLQEKENLEQEYKTALEINVENAKQFEAQLTQARDSMRSKIRVPVKKEQSAFATLFGIKTLPLIEEIEIISKSSFALRRSYFLRIWEEKYLILSGSVLYIFDSNKPGTRATAEIELHLQGSIVSIANKATGKANSFGIFQPGKKDNYFQSRNAEEVASWINVIQAVITPKSPSKNLRSPSSQM